MTKRYITEKLNSICWQLYLISRDMEINNKDYSKKDLKRFNEAFQTLKNLQFQWEEEKKK